MRFRSQSLEQDLQLALAISLIILIGILWFTGSRYLQGMTEDYIASRMEHDAEALLGNLLLSPQLLKVRPTRINQIYLRPFSGHYYVIRLSDGREETSRSLWDFKLQLPQLSAGQSKRFTLAGPADQKLLVWSNGYRKQGQEMTISIAEDVTAIELERRQFLLNFAMLSLLSLVLLLLLQHWVIRRAFQRLEPLRDEIKHLAESGGHQLNEDVPTEIRPLVQEVNHLLQLLMQRNERSRNALGNLAHALKGPLNLLGRYFDRLCKQERQGEGDAAAAQAERIRLLIERELKRARMVGLGSPSQRFDPHQDLRDLISVVGQIHQERALKVAVRVAEGMPLFGDREDMFELIGNLLDNAFKWAASQISIEINGDATVRICVEDDGQGLSDEDLRRLTLRGSRLDESIEGYGLGLAIALDIAKLYGGGILFERSPMLHGLRVSVTLKRQN